MRINKDKLRELLDKCAYKSEVEIVVNTESEAFPDVIDIRIMLLDDHGKLHEEDEYAQLGITGQPYQEVLAIEVA